MHHLLQHICEQITATPQGQSPAPISEATAIAVSLLPDEHLLDILATAQLMRSVAKPTPISRCGIINAKSGRCPENCAFCAQSAHHNGNAPQHPLVNTETLLNQAIRFSDAGVERYGIVTSGTRLSQRELDSLCESAQSIRQKTGIALCASLGQLTKEAATQLKQAGFSSYHHNLETSQSFFPSICSTHAYEEDIETVCVAAQAGLRTCSGGLFGMGESMAQRAELATTLAKINVDSVPINFLHPIAGTPMGERPCMNPMEALRTIALFRLMLPTCDIVVCGGRQKTLGMWQSWIFLAGASNIMVGNYLTVKGSVMDEDYTMLDILGLLPKG